LEQIVSTDSVLGLTFVPAFVSQAILAWTRERAQVRIDLGIDDPSAPISLTRPYQMPDAPRPGQSCEDVRAENARNHVEYTYGDTDAEATPEAAAALAAWEASHPEPQATLAEVVAHLEAAREAVGITRVALGGDYD
ncbi:membrane dipeptidase, partial [Bacillus subtilis]|uniref:membrane dipeptidase n=1 Tax=Bacillus subtilis TaxID=1423 RepID=UPI00397EA3A2